MKTSKLNLLAALAWTILFVVTIFVYGAVVPKYLYLIVIGVIIFGHLLDYFALKGADK